MDVNNRDLDLVLAALRQAFHHLKAVVDVLHEDVGVSAPMRAVMETLHLHGHQTVPQIAQARPTSRQYVQRVVDELLAAGWVILVANEGHKRSPFVELTLPGRKVFAAVRRAEAKPLARLGEGLTPAQLQATHAVLQTLADRAKAELVHHP